ncbi:unnamed protein product [Urochloa decumbens]|uniref:Sulfotransferase n=1 Tax=Urochloa decumbens TaxID=240449 RepID=A0ABC9FTX6_9POAL
MAAVYGDASALQVPSGSGPVPFKDMDDDGTAPAEHTTPSPMEDLGDLALPRSQKPSVHLLPYQGCWLPDYWVPGVIEFQRRFNPRHDDVILASYPKCGTTWLIALAFTAAARRAYPPAAAVGEHAHPLRRLHPHDVVPLVEEVFARGEEARLDALPSPRLMRTHLPFTLLPPPVAAAGAGDGCRVVYVCRDPKDMVVSLWHFLRRSSKCEDISFAELFDAVCDGTSALGPVWEHALSYWRTSVERPDRVLFLRYNEDLLRNTGESVRRLAGFMGRPFSATEEAAGAVAAVVELCSLGNMKALEVNKAGNVAVGNLDMPRDSFFRKGVAGDWASIMTVEMATRMDEIFREKLLGTGFSFV